MKLGDVRKLCLTGNEQSLSSQEKQTKDALALCQEGEATHCSFSAPIELEAGRWLESTVQEVQCSTCGSVSKAKLKGQSVVIVPHPPRKSRPVRNVTRWAEQGSEWVLVQKKE